MIHVDIARKNLLRVSGLTAVGKAIVASSGSSKRFIYKNKKNPKNLFK